MYRLPRMKESTDRKSTPTVQRSDSYCVECRSSNENVAQRDQKSTGSLVERSSKKVGTVTESEGDGKKEANRQQNRTAQRNHRKLRATRPKQVHQLTYLGDLGRRLREQSEAASSEHSSDPHDRQDPSTLPSHQCICSAGPDHLPTFSSLLQSQPMDAMMADDMSVKSTPSWTGFDPIMPHMPGGDALSSNPNSFSFPLTQGCTCNGMTGPCARHLEEMRFQIFNTNISAPPHFLSPYTRSRAGSQYEGSQGPSAVAFEGSSPGDADIPQQPQRVLNHRSSHHSLSTSTSASTSNPQDNSNSQLRPPHRYSSSTSKLSAPSPLNFTSGALDTPLTSEASTSSSTAVSSPSDSEVAHNNKLSYSENNKPTATNTSRFKTILEAVKAAGFPDFDRMVAAYYTASFEKSSVPAMAQRASRGRRLARMLKDVHESSNRWPRWEARGFRESAMESARTICIEEIEKVTQYLDRTRPSNEGESRSGLNDLRISNADANSMFINADSSEESRLLAN